MLAVSAVAAIPAQAPAATQFGENFSTLQNCEGDTWVQSTSPGQVYAAPFDGILTSWTFRGSADSGLKLKVARPSLP